MSYKRKSSENFSLIIERITGDVDVIIDGNEQTISPKKSIDWKMAFYDEFIRYADRFYLMKMVGMLLKILAPERIKSKLPT